MSNYRRLYVNGGLYFFTAVTYNRHPHLCMPHSIHRLKNAFRYVMRKHAFHLQALVILPDHLHTIWQLPDDDCNFSLRWRMIKYYFSIGMKSNANNRREKNLWQNRFWEHCIKDEKDFARCLDYLNYNPVKHGFVKSPIDWPFSTFKRDVKNGLYTTDWGSDDEPKEISKIEWE